MQASTTAFVSDIVGSVLSNSTSALTSVFSTYIGVFMTLVVGIAVIGGIVALVKKAPRKVFGSH